VVHVDIDHHYLHCHTHLQQRFDGKQFEGFYIVLAQIHFTLEQLLVFIFEEHQSTHYSDNKATHARPRLLVNVVFESHIKQGISA